MSALPIQHKPPLSRTLVWIDTREARIVHWDGSTAEIERIESEVPEHRKATGLVRREPRYDAGLMSGGYGHPRTSDDDHRLEHMARFLDQVASRIPSDKPLDILGPGLVREHFARLIREDDARHRREREPTCAASPRLTDRQLVARIRMLAGLPGWAAARPGRASGLPAGQRGRRCP
jgi:hypothetical protein